MPSLIVLNGDHKGSEHPLHPFKPFLIGRDATADLSIIENRVSRRHARLTYDPTKDETSIEDLKSLNGTLVNDKLIDNITSLSPRDKIQIGSVVLEFIADEENRSTGPLIDIIDDVLESGVNAEQQPERHHLYQTDGTSIAGNLREISLPDLLQMLAGSKKSGKLVIAPTRKELHSSGSSDSALLWISEGAVVGAQIKDLLGEDAFYELLRWRTGYFALYYREPLSNQDNIDMPLEALLLEGFRRLDEEKTMSVQLSPGDSYDVNPDTPLNMLEPDQLRIFQLVWKKKKVAVIWDHSHLDREQTTAILRQLLRQGYILKA